MPTAWEVVQARGKYEDRDGKEKTRWQKLGVAFPSDRGHWSIKFEALPLPNSEGEVWCQVFPPRERRQGSGSGGGGRSADSEGAPAPSPDGADFNDEIPF